MSDVRALTIEAEMRQSLRAAVQGKLDEAASTEVAKRLRAGDATLWGAPGTPEVANRLGWLTIAQRMRDEVEGLRAFAAELAGEGVRDIVLLGMGGSSLAPEVFRRCFGNGAGDGASVGEDAGADGRLTLHVLDSTDAARIAAVQEAVDLQRTLFIVSSKSGGTIEPLSLFAHFWSLVGEGQRFAAITDPGTGLQKLAQEHGFRRVFAGDPEIGGRYSALSPFGIVPAALIGVDVQALLQSAERAWQATLRDEQDALPAHVWLGAALSALARAGRDKLTLLIDPTMPGLGLWLEQLVAESTGKHGTGILPVAEEPAGDADAYGDDRVFLRIADVGCEGQDELRERARSYADAGHPLITVATRGPSDLGGVFMLAELAVAVAGWGLGINPFDQPNVQQAKDATNEVLAGFQTDGALPQIGDADEQALRALLGDAAPPSYVAIMGYVQPTADFDAAVAELRASVRAARKATTTFGYGPRFLHSTGQLHKGGPKTGRFLQLLHDGATDVEIPGAKYTFTTLKNAQAIGDLRTLRELGLPAQRVRLGGEDPAAALRELTTKIKEALL